MESYTVCIDMKHSPRNFRHFFNAFGYANTDFTYTPPTKRMYDHLSSYKTDFLYMRLHNILTCHGQGDTFLMQGMDYGSPPRGSGKPADKVFSMDENGKLRYDWTLVDRVYDIFFEHSIRPIVETYGMPSCLQKSPELWFIPKDFKLWGEILREFVIHLQDRYGKEEVEQWYFEVWNEPDNHQAWVDDPSSFLALYDYCEHAIHSVNPKIKVGGPAVKQGEGAMKIFRAFLDHCSKGVNYATGEFGTRLDFISVHCKGGYSEGTNPSTDIMFNGLKSFMEFIKTYPEFDGIEFFNDESDIVWNGNLGVKYNSWLNFRNTHYAAGFTCKMMHLYCSIVEDEYGMNLSIVDSDNCHIQWEKSLFSGNRSQHTPLVKYPSTDLLKKSVFNAYVLLSRLGDKRLFTDCADEGYGTKFGVLPTIKDNALSFMVWNFEDGIYDDINPRRINLIINNIPFKGTYRLLHYRIDADNSNSYGMWKSMGKPDKPAFEQIKEIRKREGLELYEEVKSLQMEESLSFTVDLPMHAVSLFILVPENDEKPARPIIIKANAERGFSQNPQVFLKWKPSEEFDFFYYRIFRKRDDESEFAIISDTPSVNTAVFIDMDVEKEHRYTYKVQTVNASMAHSDHSDEIEVQVP